MIYNSKLLEVASDMILASTNKETQDGQKAETDTAFFHGWYMNSSVAASV